MLKNIQIFMGLMHRNGFKFRNIFLSKVLSNFSQLTFRDSRRSSKLFWSTSWILWKRSSSSTCCTAAASIWLIIFWGHPIAVHLGRLATMTSVCSSQENVQIKFLICFQTLGIMIFHLLFVHILICETVVKFFQYFIVWQGLANKLLLWKLNQNDWQ